MFSYRLVRLIESDAEALASDLEERMRENVQISHYRHIPAHELRVSTKSIATWASGCLATTNSTSNIAIARLAPAGLPRKFL